MQKTLLFVHGTGVRAAAYAATRALIERQMKQYGLEAVEFAPCLWGEEFGAELLRDGKSIPTYGDTRSPQQLLEDQGPALWETLLQDPTFELVALTRVQPDAGAPQSAIDKLLQNFSALRASKDLFSALVSVGLEHLVDGRRIKPVVGEILTGIARSDGFQRCASAPIAGQREHRDALARAVVAGLQKQALEASMPLLDAAYRDELVMRIGHLLAASQGSVITTSLAPLKALATALVQIMDEGARTWWFGGWVHAARTAAQISGVV